MYSLSLIRSITEASKHYYLKDNKVERKTTVNIYAGMIYTVDVADSEEFAELLSVLGPNDVLMYGLSGHKRINITTKTKYNRMNDLKQSSFVPRAKTHIEHKSCKGIMCIDYDPIKDASVTPLSHDELLDIIIKTCPEIQDAPMVLTHSASSHIYFGNQMLIGEKGKRIYIFVSDASDIPRALKTLYYRLVNQGHVWHITAENSVQLERSLIDTAMASPIQIDYAAGAICERPLIQRRPNPIILNNKAKPLDTKVAIPDLTNAEIEDYALGSRKKRIHTETKKTTSNPSSISYAKGQTLRGETMIDIVGYGTVSWWHIMQHREKFNKMMCIDPFREDKEKDAQIHTDGQPGIASFSHGGTFYRSEKVLTPPLGERKAGHGKIGMPLLPKPVQSKILHP